MLQAISMHWRGNGSSENESNGNGSSSKAGFKTNSEIVENFRIFEKFLGDRFSNVVPQNNLRAEKSTKVKSNFEHGITS